MTFPTRENSTSSPGIFPQKMEGKALGTRLVEFEKLGSLSSDGNENCKKATGLDNKTTNMHLHHPFWYIYLPSLHDTTLKCLISRPFFFSWTTIQCLRIELQKNLPTFDVLKEIKEARKSSMQRVFTQFKWRFCSRRRQSLSLLLKLLNFVTQLLRTKLSTKLLRNTCLFQTFGWKLFIYF